MSDGRTTVSVDDETWTQLNRRKGPGDSMDDVIRELLEIADEVEKED